MKRSIILLLLITFGILTGCGPTGDRVLVAKYMYDSGVQTPDRWDVVVFRFPQSPLENDIITNYIKRLLGLPGETIAIFFGNLFVYDGLDYSEDTKNVPPEDLWLKDYMYSNKPDAMALFQSGDFKILRKSPSTMLALRRLVYDNNHPAKDLEGILPPRWAAENGDAWSESAEKHSFSSKLNSKNGPNWLRYHHILRPEDWPDGNDIMGGAKLEEIKTRKHQPKLIRDFSGYNSYRVPDNFHGAGSQPLNWVGDLMLECDVSFETAQGEVWIELSKSVDRFQARINLSTGVCRVMRINKENPDGLELASRDTEVKSPGSYSIRFANFDERLTLWVNGSLVFGDGVEYPRSWSYDKKTETFINCGPTENDLQPVSIAANETAVNVSNLKIYRDTYYTLPNNLRRDRNNRNSMTDALLPNEAYDANSAFWSDPSQWGPLKRLDVETLFVQPGHYLCLGDNSPESSDSRAWGTVPERLMLGRALVVYFPFDRARLIR